MEKNYTVKINPIFEKVTYALLGLLILYNLLAFIGGLSILSLIPMAFQASILITLYLKKYVARTLIKIWAIFVAMAGGFKLLSYLFAYLAYLTGGSEETLNRIIINQIPIHVIELALGILFFIYVNRYITRTEIEAPRNVC